MLVKTIGSVSMDSVVMIEEANKLITFIWKMKKPRFYTWGHELAVLAFFFGK